MTNTKTSATESSLSVHQPLHFGFWPARSSSKKTLSLCSDKAVEAIRRKREPLIQVPQTQLTFHPLAERNAFRYRGVHQQSRLFALRNPQLDPDQAPTSFAEIVSDCLPVLRADSGSFALHTAMTK